MLSGLIRLLAFKTGRFRFFYRRICKPNGEEYAEFFRIHGGLHSMGDHCYISPDARITDPAFVTVGNNVRINDCTIFGHDGAVNMINRAFGLNLDSVGMVDIRDNVYIGHGCIVLQNVTIGPNAIVAAGSVVTQDIPEGSVVGGVPARPISTVREYVEKLKGMNADFPWLHLLEAQRARFDPDIERELISLRVGYFYHR